HELPNHVGTNLCDVILRHVARCNRVRIEQLVRGEVAVQRLFSVFKAPFQSESFFREADGGSEDLLMLGNDLPLNRVKGQLGKLLGNSLEYPVLSAYIPVFANARENCAELVLWNSEAES